MLFKNSSEFISRIYRVVYEEFECEKVKQVFSLFHLPSFTILFRESRAHQCMQYIFRNTRTKIRQRNIAHLCMWHKRIRAFTHFIFRCGTGRHGVEFSEIIFTHGILSIKPHSILVHTARVISFCWQRQLKSNFDGWVSFYLIPIHKRIFRCVNLIRKYYVWHR